MIRFSPLRLAALREAFSVPKTRNDLKGEIVSDDQLRGDLNGISLEDFLEAL